MTKKPGAILQFEIDIKRFTGVTEENFIGAYGETVWKRLYNMIQTAAVDTMYNGGTFVLVVGGGKLTMVQRPDAIDLDEDEPAHGAK